MGAGVARYGDIAFAVALVLVVAMMVVPVPPAVLDFLITFNLGAAIVVLLVSVYTHEPLQFSIFPSLLLVTTLFRLALNVSSTRLILLGGYAGQVIDSFGKFVLGGNAVVGFIVFAILVVVQFVVITRGSERVSEVAARFTLDAMPGKQMAIDADLNAGLINEHEARERRRAIELEADFYGAMDGASKFVKGDAIASIIIVLVNLVGGLVVGMAQRGMSLTDALSRFAVLTVGDGLSSQVPALLISTATGILVTRVAAEGNLGQQILAQVTARTRPLFVTAALLALLGLLVPGVPLWPFWLLAACLLGMGLWLVRRQRSHAAAAEAAGPARAAAAEVEEARRPEHVLRLLQVDPLEMELGYGLLPLADEAMGGDLMDRVVMIRRQVALELGLVVPYVRVRDNMSLPPNRYVIKLRGSRIGGGEVLADHYLAMDAGAATEPVPGIETQEPAFGLPALWIRPDDRERAEMAGYTVVDPASVVVTHLTELIRRHAHELLGRQEVRALLDLVKESHPAVVEELTPKTLSLGEVQKVMQNLLREGVSIRDLVTIFEVLADYGQVTRDPDVLTEQVRAALGRSICRQLGVEDTLRVVTLDPALEERVAAAVERRETGAYSQLAPEELQALVARIGAQVEQGAATGAPPLVLTAPAVRPYLRRLLERSLPRVAVLSWHEIDPGLRVEAVGTVSL